jgi:hypothetical protein
MRDGPLALLLLVAYGWLFVFSSRINNPNELVRIYAARALVEERSWSFARRERVGNRFVDTGPIYASWGYVNDKALVCDDPEARPPACAGRLYAAKAPGSSVLAAAVLALLPPLTKTQAVLVLRWILVILPSVLFWVLLRRALQDLGVEPDTALLCILCGALGSLSLTYGQMFAGHQLAALALGAAWLCGYWKEKPFWCGFFASMSVAIEYPSAPAAALLFIAVCLHRKRGVQQLVLGAIPWTLVLIQFHWSAFGAPWSTPYSHLENPGFVRDIAPGFMGISIPTWERIYGSLFAPWLGLFYWAPWMVLIAFAKPKTVPFAICLYYLVFQITHALWRSGWVIGPRYITPIVPFAVIAIAQSMTSVKKTWLCGAGAAAIAATGLASSVCQGFPLEVINPLRQVVWPLLSHGYMSRNLLQAVGAPGIWSGLPYFAALAIAIAFLLKRRPAAIAIFAALTAAQWLAPSNDDRGAAHFFAEQWEPRDPPGSTRF